MGGTKELRKTKELNDVEIFDEIWALKSLQKLLKLKIL